MDMGKFREMFLVEAGEHLQEMTQVLLALETDPMNRTAIDSLFRNAHSIKGMAGTMEFGQTTRLAHFLEDCLDDYRERGKVSGKEIDRIIAGVDLLEELLGDIREGRDERDIDSFIHHHSGTDGSGETTPKDEALAPTLSPFEAGPGMQLVLKESVAVPGPRLLVLLRKISEFGHILETIPSEEQILAGDDSRELQVRFEAGIDEDLIRRELSKFSEVQEITFSAEVAKPEPVLSQKQNPQTKTVRVSTDLLDHFINLTGELITTRYHLQNAVKERDWSDVDEGVGQLTRLVKNLHHQVLQVRMMSLENLFIRLSRTVHDLARSTGKQVSLQLEGADIELDRAIVEELTDALVHMVRNAVDHGISQQGIVQIRAWRERDQVMLQIADDGRGMDPQAIRKRAVARGLISEAQEKNLSNYDSLQLICLPGFSTTDQVTETSGRGVGMDVVKTALDKIGGLLDIDSQPGQGSRITLKLPLSLAIIRVLLVSCNHVPMGLPISRIIQTLEISRKDVRSSGKQLVVEHQGQLVPLLSLRKMLQYPKAPQGSQISVVITEALGRRFGLVVDHLIGQREVFVQRLPAPFDQVRGCSGGTMLGDGQILFLLDLQSLLEKYRG